MKIGRWAVGITAAGAACCAAPLVIAGVASTGLAGFGAAWMGWEAGLIAVVAVAGIGAFAFVRRGQAATACRSEGCGCGAVSQATKSADDPAIACSLGADDFKQRSAWIRELAGKHLRHSQRTPLTLDLTYAPEAAPQVREMVAKEQTCCSFLRFDLREEPDAVRLTITAPEKARAAADDLFDHFVPALMPRLTSNTREGVFA